MEEIKGLEVFLDGIHIGYIHKERDDDWWMRSINGRWAGTFLSYDDCYEYMIKRYKEKPWSLIKEVENERTEKNL